MLSETHQRFNQYFYLKSRFTEPVVRRCSVENLFLKILQNSQKNICVRVSILIKLQPATLLKRDSDTGVFLWILQNF